MENVNLLLSAISTLGFPIVCVLICFWYINKREESHKDERSELFKVVENNTSAMASLAAKLEGLITHGKHE